MYDAYKKQLRHIFGISRKHSDLSQMARLQVVPSIFRSVMYDGCIEKGMCEEAGGTRYPQVNPIMTARYRRRQLPAGHQAPGVPTPRRSPWPS